MMKIRFIVLLNALVCFLLMSLIVALSVKFLFIDSYNRYKTGTCLILNCSSIAHSCSSCKRHIRDEAINAAQSSGSYSSVVNNAAVSSSSSGNDCYDTCFNVTVLLQLNNTHYENLYEHTFHSDPKLCPSQQIIYKPPLVPQNSTTCYYDVHRINETLSLIHPQFTTISIVMITIFSLLAAIALLIVIVAGVMSLCYIARCEEFCLC